MCSIPDPKLIILVISGGKSIIVLLSVNHIWPKSMKLYYKILEKILLQNFTISIYATYAIGHGTLLKVAHFFLSASPLEENEILFCFL